MTQGLGSICPVDISKQENYSLEQYKAKLKENGDEVAVKVLKPNTREIIESDVKIMKFLAKRMDKYISKTRPLNLPVMVSEFERTIFKEINFQDELMNIQNLLYLE